MIALYAVFRGVTVSTDAGLQVSAYVGAIVLAIFLLRLLFVAPYAMWRDKVGEVAGLKLELTKPEQIELRRMGRIRAKKRIELAALLREMHWFNFLTTDGDISHNQRTQFGRALALIGEAGLSSAFLEGFFRYDKMVRAVNAKRREGERVPKGTAVVALGVNLLDHLHGRITAEELALKLPPEEDEGDATEPA